MSSESKWSELESGTKETLSLPDDDASDWLKRLEAAVFVHRLLKAYGFVLNEPSNAAVFTKHAEKVQICQEHQ